MALTFTTEATHQSLSVCLCGLLHPSFSVCAHAKGKYYSSVAKCSRLAYILREGKVIQSVSQLEAELEADDRQVNNLIMS